ncbi:hypothetical protein P3X46_019891 [Hevea brasiliensis]|uniref:Uncharacterized protein n=1 Tax=Hevea brasiliensis TaxID=3981 RepID=A0ABQ9LP89_HEVBR|nr:hypothetical protein P3X46_019891 [Hevea brasiliensis]
MKGHEPKMPRMEDILNLLVQDPPCAEFSATHIKWVKIEGGCQGGDDIALIPFARVGDFVKGESSNAECPASFRIESRRKRSEGSISKPRVDGSLEYTLYWCSYGPEDYRDIESGIGDGSNIKPATGKGSRPGRHHVMRGAPCHGILDLDAVGTRAMYAPRISEELRQKTDWQLQQMLRYGHSGSGASHSTFGLKKHKYPLCTLLVFDSSQNAILVVWVITSLISPDIHKWFGSLAEKIRTKDPRWRPSAFLG